jgi:hypothetical protein
MHATLRSGSVSVANDKGDCGFKISHRHFVSNGGAHNEPKFGIHRAGLCRSSRYHRIKAAKALGAAYDGAAQFLQREAAAPARGRAGTDRALGGLNALDDARRKLAGLRLH